MPGLQYMQAGQGGHKVIKVLFVFAEQVVVQLDNMELTQISTIFTR